MARLILILLLLGFFLSGWAFSEVNRTHFNNPKAKRNWLWVIILLPIIGAILFFTQQNKRN
ncbi:MAG: hypothetical protein P1U44_09275 [Vicingaceae bacterium]|nr:hypothetical protein [Flavobacteriales bacterium]MDF1675891.1 hypothetical protein [Vicingaceae bacterium]|tara:strand:+ start:15781 stop:15963 length:183 start_codon:yes stop_codon:yes gene_type:complete